MEKPTNNSRTLVRSDEIAEVLEIAQKHRWHLTYSAMAGSRRVSQTTELLDVNLQKLALVFNSEMKYTGIKPGETISFRAQSGGITLAFESQLQLVGSNSLSNKLFAECRVEFPKTVIYTQLRQAVRINCENIEKIPVTFFDGSGNHLDGEVADISAGGVKVKMMGDLSSQFKPTQTISDCRLRFPDGSVIELRVKILGVMYDKKQNISFARCCFLEIKEDIEVMLEETIFSMLQKNKELETDTALT